MTEIKDKLQTYYRTIGSFLPCSRKQKKLLLNGIQENVENFLLEHPDADIYEIENHFGTPEQIAAACLEETTTPELLHKLRIKKRILITTCVALGICVLFWGIATITAAFEGIDDINGYYEIGSAVDDSNGA